MDHLDPDTGKVKSWPKIFYDFTQTTNFHGVRFISSPTPFFIRRILWLLCFLAALTGFLYFVTERYLHLKSYPRSVNVEVLYVENATFPIITICNQNSYRISKTHSIGMYDLIDKSYENSYDNIVIKDEFQLISNTILAGIGEPGDVFSGITAYVCQKICLDKSHSSTCCAVMFNRFSGTCYLTPMSDSNKATYFVNSNNTDFYRRTTCTVKTSFECDFENDCDIVNKSATRDLIWEKISFNTFKKDNKIFTINDYSKVNTLPPKFDRTTMTEHGFYIQSKSSFTQIESNAQLLTPFISTDINTCISFYYQIRNKNSVLSVKAIVRNIEVLVIWQRLKITTNTWEMAYKKLPVGFFRISIQASSIGSGSVDMSLDDIVIDKCKTKKDFQCVDSRMASGYFNGVTKSSNGRRCEKWKDVKRYLLKGLLEFWGDGMHNTSLEELSDTCRNPTSDVNGVWCVTDTDSIRLEYCSIPNCPCPPHTFTCNNGNCISKNATCDKQDDCGDLSDEIMDMCSNFENIECNFNFNNCGYLNLTGIATIKLSVNGFQYLSISSNFPGQQYITLVTPSFFLNQSSCLVFQLRLSVNLTLATSLENPLQSFNRTKNYLCTFHSVSSINEWKAGVLNVPYTNKKQIIVFDLFTRNNNFFFDLSNVSWSYMPCERYINSVIDVDDMWKNASLAINLKFEEEKQLKIIEIKNQMKTTVPTTITTTTPFFTTVDEEITTTESIESNNNTNDNNITVVPRISNIDYNSSSTISPLITIDTFYNTTDNYTMTTINENTTTEEIIIKIPELWLLQTYKNISSILTANLPPRISIPELICKVKECMNCEKPLQYFHSSDTPCSTQGIGCEEKASKRNCEKVCDFSMNCKQCDNFAFKVRSRDARYKWVIFNMKDTQENGTSINDIDGNNNNNNNNNKNNNNNGILVNETLDNDFATVMFIVDNVDTPIGNMLKDANIDLIIEYRNIQVASCLMFLYKVSRFAIYMEYDNKKKIKLYSIDDDGYQKNFNLAKVDLTIGYYRITFSLKVALKDVSVVGGIDDISINEGTCLQLNTDTTHNVNCTFDNSMEDWCGYVGGHGRFVDWRKSLDFKSSRANNGGTFYLKSTSIQLDTFQNNELISPKFQIISDVSCLQFTYFATAYAKSIISTISVLLINGDDDNDKNNNNNNNNNNNTKQVLFRQFNNEDNKWRLGIAEIKSATKGNYYKLKFSFNTINVRGGLDSIVVLPKACSKNFSCDNTGDVMCFDKNMKEFSCLPRGYVCNSVPNCNGNSDEVDCLIDKPNGGEDDKSIGNSYSKDVDIGLGGLDERTILFNNVPKIMEIASHQKEDMISDCIFERTSCNSPDFVDILTDYGKCFQYRPVNRTLLTQKTGSTFGLTLTINIEQYEYMLGPHSDAGIKVFMHDKNEIPEVRDLGFAISPGTHALIGIRKQNTINLLPPWGDCGTKYLKYYDSYYYSNCKRECERDGAEDKCGCIDAYMPLAKGESPDIFCDVSSTFGCLKKYLISADNHTKKNGGCSCPKPCSQTVYEPVISYASLSALSVQQLLTGDLTNLRNKFETATNVNQRVRSALFLEDIKSLTDLENDLGEMKGLFEQFLKDNTTSIFAKVYTAISFLPTIFETDRNTILSHLSKQLTSYENHYSRDIDVFNNNYVETINILMEVEQFVELILHSQETGKLAYLLTSTSMNARIKCDHIIQSIKVVAEKRWSRIPKDVNLPEHFNWKYKTCNETVYGSMEILKNIRNDLQIIGFQGTDNNTLYIVSNQFTKNVSLLKEKFQVLNPCLNEYYQTLLKLKDFFIMTETNLQSYQMQVGYIDESSYNFESRVTPIMLYMNKIINIKKNYQMNKISKKEMLENYQIYDNNDLLKITKEVDDFQKIVMDQLNNFLQEISNEVNDYYVKMYTLAGDNEPYFGSNRLYYDASETITIWKGIKPDLDNLVVSYSTAGNNLGMIWDRNVLLADFMKKNGKAFIEKVIQDYRQVLGQTLEDFFQQLTVNLDRIKSSINSLDQRYNDYVKDIQLDQNFVKNNFMSVDFYFSQLKEQSIQQVKDYQEIQFFSDIGGFVGLLLGGSVLAIIELIDVFIYTFALKIYYWRKKSNNMYLNNNNNGNFNSGMENVFVTEKL